ncbi:hypothetical protein CVT25_001999 [Psilocybe cyanescens]|uniref:Uncharacterized protein n=1 Tax=Psilocybe cyanescens TaxID=93625 RepID=A0A409X9D1_PSICY|nr:hypothetical protein CVT25_001999 [Psilocybe cyanescens]
MASPIWSPELNLTNIDIYRYTLRFMTLTPPTASQINLSLCVGVAAETGCQSLVLKAIPASPERTSILARVRMANNEEDIQRATFPPPFDCPASNEGLDARTRSYMSRAFEHPDAYPPDLYYTDLLLSESLNA